MLKRIVRASLLLLALPSLAHALAVTTTTPAANASNVARNTAISVTFDVALAPASITASNFRVWGQQTGPVDGATVFSNSDRTLTFTPAEPFFPGEVVNVQFASSVAAANATTLRSAGYSFQFLTAAGIAPMTFTKIDTVSVRTSASTTRLYGGAYADLDEDGWIDYIAVNEVSADLRVMLNRADGSGLLGPVLTPPTAIGSRPARTRAATSTTTASSTSPPAIPAATA